MLLAIDHSTRYRYDEPVPYGLMQVRLTPQSGPLQKVLSWSTTVTGAQVHVEFSDHHGNLVQLLGTETDASEVEITASGRVETQDESGVMRHHDGPAPLWLYTRQTPFTIPGPNVSGLAESLDLRSIASLHELSHQIREAVAYETGRTSSDTTAEQAMETGAGVCQDHALIFIAACRARSVPVRYVSGYLHTPEENREVASHAWAEAWVEDLGWVGFDISNGVSPDERYVRIAAGVDYVDIAPVSGMRLGPGDETLDVALTVRKQQQRNQQQ